MSLHRLVSGCQRVQSRQVQCDGSSVGRFWSNTSGGFVLTHTVGTILSLETCLRASKGGTVYVLPLRVEPYTGQTLIWPAAGGLLRRHRCADLAWGSVGQTPLSGWDRLGMRGFSMRSLGVTCDRGRMAMEKHLTMRSPLSEEIQLVVPALHWSRMFIASSA